jgi:endonuclease-3
MAENQADRILRTLKETSTVPKWATLNQEAFETLVVTIISQNTAGVNTSKAFDKLSNRFRIRPEVLAKAEVGEIEECLKVAGLYRNKARAIKQVSRIVVDEFQGNLGQVLSLPLREARRTLLKLPGVGPKTADVVLLFCAGKPTVPVDTHVDRVSKRLGLAPEKGDYEAVRTSLQGLYSRKDYTSVHVLLILLGRRYCRARTPLCEECPSNWLCPSRHK